MNQPNTIAKPLPDGGAELNIADMGKYQMENLAFKTLRFVRRIRHNPEVWAQIQKRAAEIREQGLYT